MFSGDLIPQLIAGVVVAVVVLLLAAWALGFLDPFEVDERITQPPGHEALDSMAEWSRSVSTAQAIRAMNNANAWDSQRDRIANAGINIQAAIGARAARDSRVLDYHFLDEDGDVDTKPPLNADQEAMLRKIDLVELQVVNQARLSDWRASRWIDKGDMAAVPLRPAWWHGLHGQSMPAFPVSLIGRGVDIPHPAQSEVLA